MRAIGLAVLLCAISNPARATEYYVRNGGNDALSGRSPADAWASLTRVAGTVFLPGDVINLERGSVWRETLVLNGAGTTAQPITVTAYGLGPRPRIAPATVDSTCVRLNAGQGWRITGLELADARWGVELRYDDQRDRQGVTLDNLYIHDMTSEYNSDPEKYNYLSAAIAIRYWTSVHGVTFLRDLTVKDVAIERCNFGLWSGVICEGVTEYGEPRCDAVNGFERVGRYAFVDGFTFDRVTVTDAPQMGLSFIGFRNGWVGNSTINWVGYAGWQYGTCGGLIARSQNVTFDGLNIYNVFRGPQPFDGCGWDFEGGNDAVRFLNAEIYATDGAGIFVFDNGGNAGPNTNLWIENVRVSHFGRNPGNTREGILFALTSLERGSHTGTAKWSRFNDSQGQQHVASTHPGQYDTAPGAPFFLDSCEYSVVLSTNRPTGASSWVPGYEPGKAVDWNWSSTWVANGPAMPQSLWIDLGTTRAVTRIEQKFNNPSTWRVAFDGSNDGITWVNIANWSNGIDGDLVMYNGGGMYRFIGMRVLDGAGHWASSQEFTVMGY